MPAELQQAETLLDDSLVDSICCHEALCCLSIGAPIINVYCVSILSPATAGKSFKQIEHIHMHIVMLGA